MKLTRDTIIEGRILKEGTEIKIKENRGASIINNNKIDNRNFPSSLLSDLKAMNIAEFREKGYLQEINRRFLHPLGLALVTECEEDGQTKIIGVWDSRDDPEGITFGLEGTTEERLNRFTENEKFITNELVKRLEYRRNNLGFEIEPIR